MDNNNRQSYGEDPWDTEEMIRWKRTQEPRERKANEAAIRKLEETTRQTKQTWGLK